MKSAIVSLADKYKDSFYHVLLRYHVRGAKKVLDVGCGAASPLQYVRKTFLSVGVDAHKKSIALSKKRRIHDQYVCIDIRNIEENFKKQTFDVAVVLDVVEHLQKMESKRLLKRLEKIAKEKVIVLTPNGFYNQGQLAGNPYQVHKSGWSVEDFQSMGYRVYGLRGAKFIRGPHATIKLNPWIFWGICAFISEFLLFFFPSLSYDLFAVKNCERNTEKDGLR